MFDGIIANPPYIPSGRVDQLPLEVRQEPRESLDGGADGLRDVRELLEEAPGRLRPGGLMALECGEDQVDSILGEIRAAPWVGEVRPLHDLAGRSRGVVINRTES
jgi:release factor glutamine methyltransferase